MEIKKKYNVGMLQIQARINNGFVTMTTNMPQVVRQIYEIKKSEGKKIRYNERLQCLVEYYDGKTAEQIAEIVDNEVKLAFKQGYETFKGKAK